MFHAVSVRPRKGLDERKEARDFLLGDAEGVLNDPLALTIEDPDARGERRYAAIGLGSAGELLVVIYTERVGEYRLISARRATRKERNAYEA